MFFHLKLWEEKEHWDSLERTKKALGSLVVGCACVNKRDSSKSKRPPNPERQKKGRETRMKKGDACVMTVQLKAKQTEIVWEMDGYLDKKKEKKQR